MTTLDPALVTDWFAVHARDLPWRRPGFSAWGTLVSTTGCRCPCANTAIARAV